MSLDDQSTPYALGQRMIEKRRSLRWKKRVFAHRIIHSTLLARSEWQKAETICLYISTPDEVDTRKLLRENKSFVVPRVSGSQLVLCEVGQRDDLVEGAYGILEAKLACPTRDSSSVDVFIVPGVAFDRYGFRLGRGKGYYDRLLQGVKATKIALSYSFQIVPRLPHKKYDIPMDVVISEKEVLEI